MAVQTMTLGLFLIDFLLATATGISHLMNGSAERPRKCEFKDTLRISVLHCNVHSTTDPMSHP